MTLLAIREFPDKPIPSETIHRIVEAGRLTGSSMNKQPWHFIVVENRDSLRQLGALAKPAHTSRRQRWQLSW
jgi:nitroreductase